MRLIYEWTPPTTNVDGSTIPVTGPGSLSSTRIQFGVRIGPSGDARYEVYEERVVRESKLSAEFITDQPATYFARAFVTNTYGRESTTATVATYLVGVP